MTFTILSVSYRTLQSVLSCPENTVKRNARADVLRAEALRLLNEGVLTIAQLEALPPSAPARSKFDWCGLATDRKDATATLKVLRSTGFTFSTEFKLNGTNVALLAALTEFANSAPRTITEPTPKVSKVHKATTKAQTIAAPATTTVKVRTKRAPKKLTEQEVCSNLLAERTRLEIRLALTPECAYTEELLEECAEAISELPARAFC